MSNLLPVELPPALEAEIRRHAEEAYPLEACGAILGEGDGVTAPWRVVSVQRAANQHGDDQRRRYLVPPELQLQLEKKARAEGLDIIGYYHSHPDHPAQPSEYDRSHAWFGYLYLICAVERGRSALLNGFTLEEQDGRFLPVPLKCEPWEGSQPLPRRAAGGQSPPLPTQLKTEE